MSYVDESKINVENTTVTAIVQLRRFRDIILCRGEDGSYCCSCTGCKFKKPQSSKPGYRQKHAIAGEITVVEDRKHGKKVKERYNGIITVRENKEPRRRKDGKNEESYSNEMRCKRRVSRRDNHEKKKAKENVEKVEEKRSLGEAARIDKHEEEKAMTSVLINVKKEDEGYPAKLEINAVPGKNASSDFRSKVNTINEYNVHGRKSKKALRTLQFEDKNVDKGVRFKLLRPQKETISGRGEEQIIEDSKSQIMEIISYNIGNEAKERSSEKPSSEYTNEIKDAKESLVGKEARLHVRKSVEILSYQESPLVSNQEDSGLSDEEQMAASLVPIPVKVVDVSHLSNETLSMTAGVGPVPVKAVDASSTIMRRKSVTFDATTTRTQLLVYKRDEDYSSYQGNPTQRKFPDGQDDFAIYSNSDMNESQVVENLPIATSHTETCSHLADSEPVLQQVDATNIKQNKNYQTILEITQKSVSLYNEEKQTQEQNVSEGMEPANKDEDLTKNKLDMVFHEDEADKKVYEYEEEEDDNKSPGHKGPSKYPGDEDLHKRGSATIPSGHSDLFCPNEQADSVMTTGRSCSIQAASYVQNPSSLESKEQCVGTWPIRDISQPLDCKEDDQLQVYHGFSVLKEEEAQQRETDGNQDGRELWRTNLPPPLPKPDLLAPNPFPRRGSSLPVVRGPLLQNSLQGTTISGHRRINGPSSSLSKFPLSVNSHDLAKESARIPTTMPSRSRPFDQIQSRKVAEAHDAIFKAPGQSNPPLKNNFKEILAPINGRSPSPVLHDVLLRGNVPHSYPIPKPPPFPRQAWSEGNGKHEIEYGAWSTDDCMMTKVEEEPYIHYPHPPNTPAPKIHQPHPPSTPVTSSSSSSHLRRYKLRAYNFPGFQN